jgi:hypothetical protein
LLGILLSGSCAVALQVYREIQPTPESFDDEDLDVAHVAGSRRR